MEINRWHGVFNKQQNETNLQLLNSEQLQSDAQFFIPTDPLESNGYTAKNTTTVFWHSLDTNPLRLMNFALQMLLFKEDQ